MKIEIDGDVIEFVPETKEEAQALGRLSEVVLEAARAERKIVPQNEYLACVAGPMKLVVRDR
jgi:hypothetical protein